MENDDSFISGELNPPEKAESLTEALLIDPLRPLTVLYRQPALFADGTAMNSRWHQNLQMVGDSLPLDYSPAGLAE